MNLTALQTRVAEEAGLDTTNDATRITAWINGAYQHVSGLFNWPWLFKSTILQTVADITTGTASVNATSTSVTLTVAPASSVANDYMIQFPTTSDDWYYISAHTGGQTTLTISVPFTGSSNVTGATYTIRRVFYSLASDVDRIIDFRQTITDSKLEYVDPRTFDRILPDPSFTGTPLYYGLLGLDSSSNWRVNFYPIPNAVTNLQLKYYSKVTELSSGSDVPVIPLKWNNALVFGALALYGHAYIDDTRLKSAADRFNIIVEEMMEHYNPVPDQRTVIQPWDLRPRKYVFRARYPSNYPDI